MCVKCEMLLRYSMEIHQSLEVQGGRVADFRVTSRLVGVEAVSLHAVPRGTVQKERTLGRALGDSGGKGKP